MRLRRAVLVLLVVIETIQWRALAQGPGDWVQWRGPARDGAAPAFKVPAAWPEQLTRKWKTEVGLGYATPLLVGNRIYIFSRQGENETMSALDAETGAVLWKTGYPAAFTMQSATVRHGAGPKSTPVYSGGKLFSIGMTGVVTAFDAATGKQIWQKPGSPVVPTFTTHSFSPVVERGLVIFHVGGHNQGALTAFDMNTGDVRWSWTGDGPGYGSPVIAEIDSTRQLITITQGKLIGVDVATGALLWERSFVSNNNTNSATPVLSGRTIIASNGGPVTAVTVSKKAGQWAVENAWENPDAPFRFSNAVLSGDVVFGLSTRNSGQYFALDAKTGKTIWTSEPRQAGNAAIARSGDLVLSLEDDAELVVMRAKGPSYELVRRYSVADSPTWAQAVFSGNRFVVKDEASVAVWSY
jgi:outer membrane protein assembly factor BamB